MFCLAPLGCDGAWDRCLSRGLARGTATASLAELDGAAGELGAGNASSAGGNGNSGTPLDAASGAAVGGCAAGVAGVAVCRARAAIDASPKSKPSAAAAAIVQLEPARRRRELGPLECGGHTLAASGASLSGARLTGASLDAASWRTVGGAALGVGMARSVIFSLALTGPASLSAVSFGAAGATLERASGISSDSGASPSRTTTACRGAAFKPGRAINPPRGVTASRDSGGPGSATSLSSSRRSLLMKPCFRFCRDFGRQARNVADLPTCKAENDLASEPERQQAEGRRQRLDEQDPSAHRRGAEDPGNGDAGQKERGQGAPKRALL